MLGFNSIFRLSCTVLQFHYINGAVIIQQAGPEARCISQFTIHRLRASLQRGRHRPQPSSSLPPDGPLSKAAREQEEYQQVLEVTLNLVAQLGQIPGLL